MKENTKNLNMILMAMLFAIMIAVLGFVLVVILQAKASGEADCKISGIELKDVRPEDCYADFSPQFCPVPKEISCKLKADGIPAWMMRP